jgi:hypothetical protein
LSEIDPFTFFAVFNRQIKEKNRKEILLAIMDYLGVQSPLPSDFSGLPTVNNFKSWFIALQHDGRGPNDVRVLWRVFRYALGNTPLADPGFKRAFDDALKVKGTNLNLTTGLFWIRPHLFLSLDTNIRDFLKIKLPPEGPSAAFYIETIRHAKARGESFPELSQQARDAAQEARGSLPPPQLENDAIISPIPNPPARSQFAALLDALRDAGLQFSSEIVASYLLALQTKRFVILTGISGTGKTQLAMQVARHFAETIATTKPVSIPAGATVVRVQPYMRKYHRMYLPASLVSVLQLPQVDPLQNSGSIRAEFPGGKATLGFWRQPSSTLLNINFREPFRTWFEAECSEGDEVIIDFDPSESESGDLLKFSKPRLSQVQETLRNLAVVAVRPDWTDNRGLLGYLNPLTEQYILTPFLDHLLEAREEWDLAETEAREPAPFFAVLDEMNLARVEHYFSDFLSCLESGEALQLYSASISIGVGTADYAVLREMHIPRNFFFVGTVNVDETTYMFSPKVLDRAFTLELDAVDLAGYGAGGSSPDHEESLILDRFTGLGSSGEAPTLVDWNAFGRLESGDLRSLIIDLNRLLAKWHRQFGYRVANEIARFVCLANEQTGNNVSSTWTALDIAVLQKVLPKFHGTQQELQEPVDALLAFAITGGKPGFPVELRLNDWTPEAGRLMPPNEDNWTARATLPRTACKLWLMRRRLRDQGFTSYLE